MSSLVTEYCTISSLAVQSVSFTQHLYMCIFFIYIYKRNCYCNYVIMKVSSLTCWSDLVTIKAALTQDLCRDQVIKHALDIQAAFAAKNFHRFFKLYERAPKMSGYLIDWFLERVRKEAIKILVKSYVLLLSMGWGLGISFLICLYKKLITVSIFLDYFYICPSDFVFFPSRLCGKLK